MAEETTKNPFLDMDKDELKKIAKERGLIQGTSGIESAARGLVQGATFGFADEIEAGLQSAFTEKTYDQAKREAELEYKEAQNDNPGIYGTADVVGGIATSLALPGGIAAKTAGNVALGAVAGAGRAESGEMLQGAAIGAGIGAAGSIAGKALGSLVSKAGKKVSQSLTKLQKNQVIEAGFGSGTGAQTAAIRFKIKNLRSSEDDIIDYIMNAKHAVEEGVELAGKPVVLGEGVDATFESVQSHLGTVGKKIGDTMDELNTIGKMYDKNALLNLVDESLKGSRRTAIDSGTESTLKGWHDEALEAISSKIQGNEVSPGALFRLMAEETPTLYKRGINAVPGGVEAQQKAWGAVADFMEQDVVKVLGKTKGAELLEMKKLYSSGKTMLDILQKKVGQDTGLQGMAKKMMSFRGAVVGTSAYVLTQNPLAAMALTTAANELIESPQIAMAAAKAMNSNAVTKMITKINLGDKVAQKSGERLVAAASRSDAIFNLVVQQEVARHSLIDMPLNRSTNEAWNRAHEILPLLRGVDATLANEAQKALDNDDKQMFGAIVHGVSNSQMTNRLIKPGIGWDGKAVTPEEKVMVKSQIQGANIPYSVKLKMLRQFKQDSMIPDLAAIQGRVVNGYKEEALRPRSQSGRKKEQY